MPSPGVPPARPLPARSATALLVALVLTGLLVLPPGSALAAADAAADAAPAGAITWPQFLGPDRDAAVDGASGLPAGDGPLVARELWRHPMGSGYSALTVVADRVYSVEQGEDHREAAEKATEEGTEQGTDDPTVDRVVALDAATGERLWTTPIGPTHRGHTGSEDGPIATPAVAEGRLFTLSAHGVLYGLATEDGEVLWQRDLVAELGAAPPYYGFATSPLLVPGEGDGSEEGNGSEEDEGSEVDKASGDRVVVAVGGSEGAHALVAFDPASGETLWSTEQKAVMGYSSPTLLTVAGVRQIVVTAESGIYAVDPADGRVLWSHPADLVWVLTAVAVPGDRLFIPAWESSLMLAVKRSEDGSLSAERLWETSNLKRSLSPAVYHQGSLFGFKGTSLVCLDPDTGEVRWRERTYEGSLIRVDDQLVILGFRTGRLLVVPARAEGYRERLSQALLTPGPPSATGPVFASGTVYLRNLDERVALRLEEAPAGEGEESTDDGDGDSDGGDGDEDGEVTP